VEWHVYYEFADQTFIFTFSFKSLELLIFHFNSVKSWIDLLFQAFQAWLFQANPWIVSGLNPSIVSGVNPFFNSPSTRLCQVTCVVTFLNFQQSWQVFQVFKWYLYSVLNFSTPKNKKMIIEFFFIQIFANSLTLGNEAFHRFHFPTKFMTLITINYVFHLLCYLYFTFQSNLWF